LLLYDRLCLLNIVVELYANKYVITVFFNYFIILLFLIFLLINSWLFKERV